MTEHTELTAGRLSDVEVTKIAWDAEKCCSGHARCDDFERAINKALDMQAKLTSVAKANVGAGVAVAFREDVCSVLGEHVDTEDSRIIAAIAHLRAQCREAATPSTAQAAMPDGTPPLSEVLDRIFNRSTHCTVTDGAGHVHSGIKVKVTDLRDLRAHCLALKREPALTGDLKVGAGLFRKGVSLSTVQGAIDRQINDYLVRPMTYFSTDGCEKHHGQGWSGLLSSGPVMMPTKVCPLCKEDANCLALKKGA